MVINESISIAQKPDSVWEYWMDVSNDIHWRNGITKAAWTSQPPYGIGSTGEHTHKNMGAMSWEVTAFNDGSYFEFIHTAGGLKGSIAIFNVESRNNGSRVNVQMRVSGPFIMRFMMLFMAGMIRKGVRGDLEKLKDFWKKRVLTPSKSLKLIATCLSLCQIGKSPPRDDGPVPPFCDPSWMGMKGGCINPVV